jgi:hypothetical protein
MRFGLAFIFTGLFIATAGQALKKYPVGNTGCEVYFFCNPGVFSKEVSADSSEVYTGECKASDGLSYGLVCVALGVEARADDMRKAEDILQSYMDYLKARLNITYASGYRRDYRLRNNEHSRGILDYWRDKQNNNWKVKGWTDGKYMGVLYVVFKDEISEEKSDVFLDGFIIPEM